MNDANRLQLCCRPALDNSAIIHLKSVKCWFSSITVKSLAIMKCV